MKSRELPIQPMRAAMLGLFGVATVMLSSVAFFVVFLVFSTRVMRRKES